MDGTLLETTWIRPEPGLESDDAALCERIIPFGNKRSQSDSNHSKMFKLTHNTLHYEMRLYCVITYNVLEHNMSHSCS